MNHFPEQPAPTILLSYTLRPGDPLPPAIPAPRLVPFLTLEHDGARVYRLEVANHSGTHVDAPAHVIADGLRIEEFRPEELLFRRPVVVDVQVPDGGLLEPADLHPHAAAMGGADLLLLRFGYGAVRAGDPARYSSCCPGLSVAAADHLRETCPGLRALGMDVPSIACIAQLERTMPAHHALLGGSGRRFLIIEDMRLEMDLGALHAVFLAPWLVAGMDSAPCAVYGFM
ncbi:MAG TPA: cyclase family protein [Chloroflexota bacterium]|nr:cyclase family protein [Chloroflexota bacterium]